MFLEEVKKSFVAQGLAMADQRNQAAAAEYLDACRNWAAQAVRGAEPKPTLAVKAVFDFSGFWGIEFISTGKPVSDVAPSSFLPKFATDKNAIGYPVGGPIPNQQGRYYDFSSAASTVGQRAVVNGKTYEYQGFTPFDRAWVEITNG